MWGSSSCADIRSGASADNYGKSSVVVVECRKVHLEEEVEIENNSVKYYRELAVVVVVVVVVPL